jgi:ribosome recycling factor
MAEVESYYKAAEEKMVSAIQYLDNSLARIRAGKANVRILDSIKVEYYGSVVPLSNVATITTPDARTISIQPWEKKVMPDIEKAIFNSDLGITPDNNGEIIRLMIPVLTEERRKTLVKQAKTDAEEAKIRVRNARRDAIEGLKKEVKNGLAEDMEKDAEAEVQKIHDRFISKIDDLFSAKEKEIMTV